MHYVSIRRQSPITSGQPRSPVVHDVHPHSSVAPSSEGDVTGAEHLCKKKSHSYVCIRSSNHVHQSELAATRSLTTAGLVYAHDHGLLGTIDLSARLVPIDLERR